MTDSVHQAAAGFIGYWEGFEPIAYWDVNHYRIGFGSDTEGAEQINVVRGMRTTRERALANLEIRIPQYEGVCKKQLGEDLYNKLGTATKVAIIDMAYNYGSIPNSVVHAFLNASTMVSSAIRGHEPDNRKINEDRRAGEAALVALDGGQVP